MLMIAWIFVSPLFAANPGNYKTDGVDIWVYPRGSSYGVSISTIHGQGTCSFSADFTEVDENDLRFASGTCHIRVLESDDDQTLSVTASAACDADVRNCQSGGRLSVRGARLAGRRQ